MGLAGARRVADQEAAPAHGRRHGEKQRGRREGDGGEGSSVNKTKFKTPVCKLKFLFLFQVSNEKLLNTKLA